MKNFISFFLASCLASFLVACELNGSGGGGGGDSSDNTAVRRGLSGVISVSGNVVSLSDGWTLIVPNSVSKQRGSCSGFESVPTSDIRPTDIIRYALPINSETTDVAQRTGVPIQINVFSEECIEFIEQDMSGCGCMDKE